MKTTSNEPAAPQSPLGPPASDATGRRSAAKERLGQALGKVSSTIEGIPKAFESIPTTIAQHLPGVQPRLGVALSGGSVRGFAHAGVFKFLAERGVTPSIVSGTSAGALFGALWADGYSPERALALFSGRSFTHFTRAQIPIRGLLSTEPLRHFLRTHLRAERFEELVHPFCAVATDLDSGTYRVFETGPLADAVRASCSLPIVFNPVQIDGHAYVDGGVTMNLPASVIRPRCDFVLGVNLIPDESGLPYAGRHLIDVATRTYRLMFYANSVSEQAYCDALIESPEFSAFSPFDMSAAECFCDIGYYLAVKLYRQDKRFAKIIDALAGKSPLPPYPARQGQPAVASLLSKRF